MASILGWTRCIQRHICISVCKKSHAVSMCVHRTLIATHIHNIKHNIIKYIIQDVFASVLLHQLLLMTFIPFHVDF